MAYTGRSPQAVLKQRFYVAKGNATVPFLLTYEQWVWLWERALGPDWIKQRGPLCDQYCMARFGDRGPYEIGNVEIITGLQNRRLAKTRRYDFSQLNGVLSLSC